MNLFEHAETYPQSPGYKERGGASEDAAHAIKPKAATIRKEVLQVLERHPEGCTAPKVRRILKNKYTLNSIRSRLSELSKPCRETNEVYAEKHGRRPDPESDFDIAVYRSLLFRGA